MTHSEILEKFFQRTYETDLHELRSGESDFASSSDFVSEYIKSLTDISLVEFFNYLDNHPVFTKISTKDLTLCGTLRACTDELCDLLLQCGDIGLSSVEIGKAEVYQKYLKTHNKTSWSRFGNNQTKTACQLGLTYKVSRQWFLSCYGHAYGSSLMTEVRQKKLLARALLRHPFFSKVLLQLRSEEVHLSHFMKGLSGSTMSVRVGRIVNLLQIALDEMDSEVIKRCDLYLPRYHRQTKTLSERVMKGSKRVTDSYAVNDDFFEGGVPLYSVKAACGYFVDHSVPEQDGWMDLSSCGVRTNSEDYFVVHAKGDSMTPKINDGDMCLFRWYRGETLYDDIVLTQCRDYDSEYESSYTIKRFHRNDFREGEARTVSLQPLNTQHYSPLLLSEEDGCEYKTIGIFVKVLA